MSDPDLVRLLTSGYLKSRASQLKHHRAKCHGDLLQNMAAAVRISADDRIERKEHQATSGLQNILDWDSLAGLWMVLRMFSGVTIPGFPVASKAPSDSVVHVVAPTAPRIDASLEGDLSLL